MALARFHHEGDAGAISLRQTVVGGQLDDGKISPPELLVDADRVLVLIHGFNVTQGDADRSYDEFVNHLSTDVRTQVVRLYWPGDAATKADTARSARGFFSRVKSAFSYPVTPEVAIESAQQLRILLMRAFRERQAQGRNRPLEICFVAHSLGCRLTIEAIELLLGATGTSAELPFTVLMAAAVPQFLVTSGRFRNTIAQLPRLWVLHSRSDGVLFWAFRPGQILDTPWHRVRSVAALGRSGIVSSERVSVVEGQWGHSEYWRDRDIAEAVDTELSGRRSHGSAFKSFERRIWQREVDERRSEARAVAPLAPAW